MKMFAKIIERFRKQFSRSEYHKCDTGNILEGLTSRSSRSARSIGLSENGGGAPLVSLLPEHAAPNDDDEMMTITTMLMTMTMAAMRLMIKM